MMTQINALGNIWTLLQSKHWANITWKSVRVVVQISQSFFLSYHCKGTHSRLFPKSYGMTHDSKLKSKVVKQLHWYWYVWLLRILISSTFIDSRITADCIPSNTNDYLLAVVIRLREMFGRFCLPFRFPVLVLCQNLHSVVSENVFYHSYNSFWHDTDLHGQTEVSDIAIVHLVQCSIAYSWPF